MKSSPLPILASLLVAAFAPSAPLPADTLIVDAGNPSAPYHTIQSALDKAKAGDTVHVKPGIYHERVEFKNGGTPGSPVTLEGEAGTILDGSENIKIDWQPAPDIGPGVYRASFDFFPFTITVNGQIITTLDEKRCSPDKPQQIHNGWANLDWHKVFGGAGVGPSGWDGVRGLGMYLSKEKQFLIRFKDQLDPRTMTITVAPRKPSVLISGLDHCVVRSLMIRYGSYGVVIDHSVGSVVENCTIGPVDYGVTLNAGADRCIVQYNDISYQPYADASYTSYGQWDNWQACKTGGYYNRWAVAAALSDGGHHIHDNYFHDEWDGIHAASTSFDTGKPVAAGGPNINANIEVDHNYLYRIYDNGMRMDGSLRNVRLHDNIYNHCRCAVRIAAPTLGPFFNYHNVFIDDGEDYRNWGEYSFAVAYDPASTKAEVWVYQNTSTSPPAIMMNYTPTSPKGVVSAVNYHYFNNLFWCEKWAAKSSRLLPNPDWKGDYNVFVQANDANPYPWTERNPHKNTNLIQDWIDGTALAKVCGIDLHSIFINDMPPGFTNAAQGDFSLTADSVARGKGLDLSTVTDMAGEPLPGIAKGYFTGKQPDVGALQYGQPMFHVPRKPEEVKEVTAGM